MFKKLFKKKPKKLREWTKEECEPYAKKWDASFENYIEPEDSKLYRKRIFWSGYISFCFTLVDLYAQIQSLEKFSLLETDERVSAMSPTEQIIMASIMRRYTANIEFTFDASLQFAYALAGPAYITSTNPKDFERNGITKDFTIKKYQEDCKKDDVLKEGLNRSYQNMFADGELTPTISYEEYEKLVNCPDVLKLFRDSLDRACKDYYYYFISEDLRDLPGDVTSCFISKEAREAFYAPYHARADRWEAMGEAKRKAQKRK